MLIKVCPKPWRYSTAEQTQCLPTWGRISTIYGEGGFLAELGYKKNSASIVISELNQCNWLDRFTSAVLVEFTVFNSRVNLFSTVWIPVEFSPSGHVVSSHVIRTIHVYNIGAGYSAVLLVCQIMLVLFIIYFIYKEAKEMIQVRELYFLHFLNWVELAQILSSIAFLVIHVLKEIELFANTAKLHENIFQFISFDREVLLDDIETALLALLMFFNTLKLLYLFRFSSHVNHLSDVMKASALELLNCSFVFFIFLFAFCHFAYLQFGRELQDYSSPINSVQSLLIQAVVGDGAAHLQDCHVLIGPLFFIVYNICLQVIWINIFIAILNSDYQTAKEDSKGKFNLGRFMMVKLKELLNCVGDTPKEGSFDDDDNNTNNKGNKKGKQRPQKELPEVKPDLLSELDKRMARINESLNDLYVDEFSGDMDVLSMSLDARARGSTETAGTHSAEEGSRVVHGGRRLFPVPQHAQGLKSTSVDRGV